MESGGNEDEARAGRMEVAWEHEEREGKRLTCFLSIAPFISFASFLCCLHLSLVKKDPYFVTCAQRTLGTDNFLIFVVTNGRGTRYAVHISLRDEGQFDYFRSCIVPFPKGGPNAEGTKITQL
jgi:hypothetical protein